jgi:hypothetical protein
VARIQSSAEVLLNKGGQLRFAVAALACQMESKVARSQNGTVSTGEQGDSDMIRGKVKEFETRTHRPDQILAPWRFREDIAG